MGASPHKNTTDHAVDLDGGRTLGPGETADVETTEGFPLAQHLIDTGQLTKLRMAVPTSMVALKKETS